MVARNGRLRGGGSTEFAALRCYVFQHSMRHPVRRSSLARFLAKWGLPLGKFDTLFHFLNTSRARVPKMAQNGPRSEKYLL